MRRYNPGIVAYKNIDTIPVNSEPKKKMGMGLLVPTKMMQKKEQEKVLEPVERAANYVRSIREQRETFKNGA